MVVGGLVFEELTRPYLGAWGDWARRAPPRLLVAIDREPDEAGTEPQRIVLLSSVLPDAANLGYQELRDLIVERVNGRPVASLADVRRALAAPERGFHVVDFVAGPGVHPRGPGRRGSPGRRRAPPPGLRGREARLGRALIPPY